MLEILAQYNQLPSEPALPTNIGEIVQKISNGFYRFNSLSKWINKKFSSSASLLNSNPPSFFLIIVLKGKLSLFVDYLDIIPSKSYKCNR